MSHLENFLSISYRAKKFPRYQLLIHWPEFYNPLRFSKQIKGLLIVLSLRCQPSLPSKDHCYFACLAKN